MSFLPAATRADQPIGETRKRGRDPDDANVPEDTRPDPKRAKSEATGLPWEPQESVPNSSQSQHHIPSPPDVSPDLQDTTETSIFPSQYKPYQFLLGRPAPYTFPTPRSPTPPTREPTTRGVPFSEYPRYRSPSYEELPMDGMPRSPLAESPYPSRGRTVDTENRRALAHASLSRLLKQITPSPALARSRAGERSNAGPSNARYPLALPDIGNQIIFDDPLEPFDTRGNFCDIFLGTHERAGKVALKRLRHRGGGDEDVETLTRHFKWETTIWMGLRHGHILRCLGTFTRDRHLYLVSPFMKNGTLFDWLRSGGHDGEGRLRLIYELAGALVYLHSSGIVHGDVKANNVLLSDRFQVQLCDFGLTKLAESSTTSTLKGAGSIRWQSPEIWNNEPKTFQSDAYAFAMTIVEVLTGEIPFAKITHDPAVISAVLIRSERPERAPEQSPDATSYATAWDVALGCWHQDADQRMSMEKAVELFNRSMPPQSAPEPELLLYDYFAE